MCMKQSSRNHCALKSGVVIFICLTLIPHLSYSKPLWQKDWVEYKSENFTVFSELKEKDTKKLIYELEAFRAIVLLLTNIDESVIPKIPTYITVFKKRVDDLGFRNDIAGVFMPGLRANHMVIFGNKKSVNRHVIQHEFTHFLLRNHNSLQYPTWFDEGFSELLATVRVKKDYFSYGDANKNRVSWLANSSWKPFDKLIEIEDTNKLSRRSSAIFYAQSWLLVHYLIIGRGQTSFISQLSEFLQLRKQGGEIVPSFEQAFDLPIEGLKGKVNKYFSRNLRYYKIPSSVLSIPEEGVFRKIPIDEIANRVGELCLFTGEYSNAKNILKQQSR